MVAEAGAGTRLAAAALAAGVEAVVSILVG